MDSDSAPGPSVTAGVVVPAVTSAQAQLLRSLKVKFVSKHFNHRVQNYSCRFFTSLVLIANVECCHLLERKVIFSHRAEDVLLSHRLFFGNIDIFQW